MHKTFLTNISFLYRLIYNHSNQLIGLHFEGFWGSVSVWIGKLKIPYLIGCKSFWIILFTYSHSFTKSKSNTSSIKIFLTNLIHHCEIYQDGWMLYILGRGSSSVDLIIQNTYLRNVGPQHVGSLEEMFCKCTMMTECY